MKIFLPSARTAQKVADIPNLPSFTQVIFLGDEHLEFEFPYHYTFSSTLGYWNVLNECLKRIGRLERFIWLADDINPEKEWLLNAVECFENNYPDGQGLVAMNDKLLRHGGCAFGMTTKKWLYVLFGRYRFPLGFAHGFLDTLVANRSKDLQKYYFCDLAVVEHTHHVVGKSKYDLVYKETKTRMRHNKDKLLKDRMDEKWENGDKEKALARML